MNDTIVVMRLALLFVVAACSADPTLEVTVQHPMGLVVAQTTVTVYESASLTCEQVEFGDLDADQLEAVQVAEETIFPNAPSTGALANISRTGPKIVVARGFGSDGNLAAAGCVEVDDVSGNDQVTLATDVAVIASISAADPTGLTDLYGIEVLTTDATGKTVDARPVSWRTYGPSGTVGASMAGLTAIDDGVWQPILPSCTSGGIATIHPVPPNLIGGYAVQIRVAWAIAEVPLYSALTRLDLTGSLAALGGMTGTTSPHVCALGHMAGNATSPVVACLSGPNNVAIFTASVANGMSMLSMPTNVGVTAPIGLFSLPSGSDLDIYTVDANGKLSLVYGATAPPGCKPQLTCNASAFDDLQLVPACDGISAKLLLHEPGAAANQIKQLDLTSGQLTDFGIVVKAQVASTVSFNAAGCVPDFDAKTGSSVLEQMTVLDFTGVTGAVVARAHFACPPSGACDTVDLLGGAGAGFGAASSPSLITTLLDSTGVELVPSVIVTQDGTRHLVELDRIPSAALPHVIVTGQFDSDGGLDMLWDNPLAKRGTVLDIAYSRTVNGQPLTALSPPELAFDDILVGDVNGDGFDDITLTTGSGVVVVPTRVVADTGPLMTDTTCSP